MRSVHALVTAVTLAAAVLAMAAVATAARPGFVFPGGCCYYNGEIVRTVVPPSAFPKEGTDPFFAITNGVSGQKGVVGLAPGDEGYNGGHWAFYSVTFGVGETPFLLTSQAAILAAEAAGDVTVTRVPENDFLCPIQK